MTIRESECQLKTRWEGCCCNCVNQVEIVGHPWNESSEMKTRITEVVGYGCADPLKDSSPPVVIFMDKQHGMCELYTAKD